MKNAALLRVILFASVTVAVLACQRASREQEPSVTTWGRMGRAEADSTACFWVKRDSSRIYCEYFRAGASIRKDTSGLYE